MHDSHPTIESDIPITPRSKWETVLRQMKKGDSIELTIGESCALRSQSIKLRIKITSRSTGPNKVRVWRRS